MLCRLNLRRGYRLTWLRCRRCRFSAASRDRLTLRRDRGYVRNRRLRQNRDGLFGWIDRFDRWILSALLLGFRKGVPHPRLLSGRNVTRRNCGRLLTGYSLRDFGTRCPCSRLPDMRSSLWLFACSFAGNCAALRKIRHFPDFWCFRKKRIAHRGFLCVR